MAVRKPLKQERLAAQQEKLRGMLKRNADRGRRMIARRREAGCFYDHAMVNWFVSRHREIESVYVALINEDDSIIGKQYHFDHTLLGFTSKDLIQYAETRPPTERGRIISPKRDWYTWEEGV